MRAAILLLFLPIFGFGQMDAYGEKLWVEAVAGDTITFRGEHFGIDSGPEMEFKWAIQKNGEEYGVFLEEESNLFLRVILPEGDYRIVRYTYYYTDGKVTGITESREIAFGHYAKREVKEYESLPLLPTLYGNRNANFNNNYKDRTVLPLSL